MPALHRGDNQSHRLRQPAVSKSANHCLEIDSFGDLLIDQHAKIVRRLQNNGDCRGDLFRKQTSTISLPGNRDSLILANNWDVTELAALRLG